MREFEKNEALILLIIYGEKIDVGQNTQKVNIKNFDLDTGEK